MSRATSDGGRLTPSASGPGEPPRSIGRRLWDSRSTVLLGIAIGALGALGLGLIFVAPLIVMHRQDFPLEQQYGHYVVSIAARFNAGQDQNPLAGSQREIASGRDAYTGSCAECHGANGDGKGAFGLATYPRATDLTSHDAKEKSDAELFWITKNGLSFTGMPGFGDQYNDQQIWALVGYVRALQNGQADPPAVPSPTMSQLAQADPKGNAVQRGAAAYFAAGCARCHGAVGDAPGDLGLSGGREADRAIRNGRRGMPAYGPDQISDAQLADLDAYLNTFNGGRRGSDSGERGRDSSGD